MAFLDMFLLHCKASGKIIKKSNREMNVVKIEDTNKMSETDIYLISANIKINTYIIPTPYRSISLQMASSVK